MGTDWIDGVWSKVERAEHHCRDLEREIKTFWESNPYEIGIDGDPKTGPGSYYIKSVRQQLPLSISVITGDAFHNLRTAFDRLASIAVGEPDNPNVAFPVRQSATPATKRQWEDTVRNKIPGGKTKFYEALCAMEVYIGGKDEWLWAIHYLDIVDKHRRPLLAVDANVGVIIDGAATMRGAFPDDERMSDIPPMPIMLNSADKTRAEPGAEIFRVEATNGFSYDGEPQFAFDVVLGEPATLNDRPLVPTLTNLIQVSRDCITSLIGYL